MKEQTKSAIKLLEDLTERAKELTCLYAIEEALKDPDREIEWVAERIIQAIPPGWQFPEICVARISLEGREYQSEDFHETSWKLSANILQQDQVVGTIDVYYTREPSGADVNPFLIEEQRLIETIADRFNYFLTYRKMKHLFQDWQSGGRDSSEKRSGDWEAVLDLIRQTDNALFLRISNKMLNHLCWSGIAGAEELRRSYTHVNGASVIQYEDDLPAHHASRVLAFSAEFTQRLFQVASDHLSDAEILSRIQMWIQEDKLGALLRTARRRLPLADITNALRRYFITTHTDTDSNYPLARGLKVLLIESILSDRLDYINVAKDHVDIEDIYHLLQKVVYSVESHGRLGGKSAGFFLASQILKGSGGGNGADSVLKIPKTWFIPADMMLELLHYNNMDEVVEQKYKEIERVRVEHTHVLDIFKQMEFPPEMVSGLSRIMDDLGDNPLVVRSSSLLEDRTGFACVDLCKSVFLANQGSREQRLRSLMQAVAEVYASNFGPEPIEQRAERGLLEFSEQIGVLIQEVVGFRAGPYFLPAFSGVARSRNDIQWSSEVEGDDGLVRLIPGLGSARADGANRECPVIVIPGQPSLKLEKSPEHRLCGLPRTIEVIHLESNSLQKVELCRLLRDFDYPRAQAEQIVSVIENGELQPLASDKLDYEDDQLVVSFDGLISRSPFVMQIRTVLQTLEKQLGGPVEIEFASDGEHLYLLQCQAQSLLHPSQPAPIPKEMNEEDVVFSVNRFIPNGRSNNITHIVYVDPDAYDGLDEESRHEALLPAISRLNALLPKRQFIFMGPIGAGVSGADNLGMDINYSDIKSAAAVVELVKQGRDESTVPSLGVHSLLDLMDSGIHYLPVFTEDEGTTFNEIFLTRSKNVLPELVPEYAFLADEIRVIDVKEATNGKVVQVLMNAELSEAVALLVDPDEEKGQPVQDASFEDSQAEDYWRWRYRMAEQIASHLDPDRFGVVGLYLFGSTKNGMSGPASDIDLLVHFRGTSYKRKGLVQWLEGWSLCLDEINYLRTGYRSGGLLDVHIVTDEDIARRTSYAVKINAVTDAARPLKMRDSGRAVKKAKRA